MHKEERQWHTNKCNFPGSPAEHVCTGDARPTESAAKVKKITNARVGVL